MGCFVDCCIINNSAGVVECSFIKQCFFRDCVALNVKKVNYFRGGFHTIFTQFSHSFHTVFTKVNGWECY